MELNERLELFMGMLRCKYPVDLMATDLSMTPLQDLGDDRSRLLYKMLKDSGYLDEIRTQAEQGQDIVCIGGSMGMLWGSVCLRQEGRPYRYYVLGPVLGTEIDLNDMEKELNHVLLKQNSPVDPSGYSHSVTFKIRMSDLMQSLSVLPTGKFQDDLVMMYYCVTGKACRCSDVGMLSLRNAASAPPKTKRKNDRHRTWMSEQALMHVIREGNLDYKKVLEQAGQVSNGVPVKVRDSLQQAQISGVTLATLCVRAAINGGLTPDAAYSVGDSYIQQLMDCTTLTEVAHCNHMMFDDFVHRVHKVRSNPEVSPKIQQCMDYLELHTDEDVSIEQLAKMTGYTEYYLSRKFKEETHCSLNDYSKIVRIERAKMLLYTTKLSINKIAEQLHFCSGSYFAREFQRFAGMSPAEYRAENTK